MDLGKIRRYLEDGLGASWENVSYVFSMFMNNPVDRSKTRMLMLIWASY